LTHDANPNLNLKSLMGAWGWKKISHQAMRQSRDAHARKIFEP
jgi:hypothetical protein